MPRVSGRDLVERRAGPGDPRRRAQRRLWLGRRTGVGGDAKPAANCAPEIQSRAALLITVEDNEAEHAARTMMAAAPPQPIFGQGL